MSDLQTKVVAQLSVRGGRAAIEFYKMAFGAVEDHRVGGTDDWEIGKPLIPWPPSR
jgi:uncharacterized glyoxalase superfamily protein PhnB